MDTVIFLVALGILAALGLDIVIHFWPRQRTWKRGYVESYNERLQVAAAKARHET